MKSGENLTNVKRIVSRFFGLFVAVVILVLWGASMVKDLGELKSSKSPSKKLKRTAIVNTLLPSLPLSV